MLRRKTWRYRPSQVLRQRVLPQNTKTQIIAISAAVLEMPLHIGAFDTSYTPSQRSCSFVANTRDHSRLREIIPGKGFVGEERMAFP